MSDAAKTQNNDLPLYSLILAARDVLNRTENRHQPFEPEIGPASPTYGYCSGCGDKWPCATERLRVTLEAVEAKEVAS